MLKIILIAKEKNQHYQRRINSLINSKNNTEQLSKKINNNKNNIVKKYNNKLRKI